MRFIAQVEFDAPDQAAAERTTFAATRPAIRNGFYGCGTEDVPTYSKTVTMKDRRKHGNIGGSGRRYHANRTGRRAGETSNPNLSPNTFYGISHDGITHF